MDFGYLLASFLGGGILGTLLMWKWLPKPEPCRYEKCNVDTLIAQKQPKKEPETNIDENLKRILEAKESPTFKVEL